MTAKHDKAWRAALSANGVDVDQVAGTLDRACCEPGIPTDEEIALAEIALRHSADMFIAGKLSLSIAYGREARSLAESLRKELELIPQVMRDRAAMKVRRGRRSSRMPLLDLWLTQQLRSREIPNKVLWKSLPSHDNDEAQTSIYRDGDDCVCERDGDKVRETTYKGFENRATAARKARAPVSN